MLYNYVNSYPAPIRNDLQHFVCFFFLNIAPQYIWGKYSIILYVFDKYDLCCFDEIIFSFPPNIKNFPQPDQF